MRQRQLFSCLLPPPADPEIELQPQDLEIRLKLLARERHREIEDYLTECRSNDRTLMKILLLGGPACGKSTIFKQMRIIHKGGFKEIGELAFFAELIFRNIRTAYEQLCSGARMLGISTMSIMNTVAMISDFFDEADDENVQTVCLELGNMLATFWASPCIQAVYAERHRLFLIDSTKYFFDNIKRIADPNYVPTQDDILHSREPTTTITFNTFQYRSVSLRLIDVGGQKSQRRKWLHLFDDVRVVLFIVDLTVYARDARDEDIGSMEQSKALFRDIATNKVLRRSMFLLFLNKVDLFKELLKTYPFRRCFPSYQGSDNIEEVGEFLFELFKKAARPRRSLIPYLTTATNTENIKHVFDASMESVFKQSVRATGIM
ncbi:unnamed protein product, partial [Mesorhabditis spiculigera]